MFNIPFVIALASNIPSNLAERMALIDKITREKAAIKRLHRIKWTFYFGKYDKDVELDRDFPPYRSLRLLKRNCFVVSQKHFN